MSGMELFYFSALAVVTCIFLLIVSYYDLKTSLIDIRIVIFFVALSFLLHLIFAFILRTHIYMLYAIGAFLLSLVVGYGFYYLSKWGEGDALVMSATYFMYPYPYFVPLHFVLWDKALYYWYVLFFNTALAGIVYSIVYAFVYIFKERRWEFFYIFKNRFSLLTLASIPVIYAITRNIVFSFSFVVLYAFYVFAHICDKYLFTKKIKLKDVKIGDTVMGSFEKAGFEGKRLDAIDENTLKKLKELYGDNTIVEVKDMVRYIPAFLIGFVLTLLVGDKVLYLLLSLLF